MYCISVLCWKIIGNCMYRNLCRVKYVVPLSACAETAFQWWLILTHTQKGMQVLCFRKVLSLYASKRISTSVLILILSAAAKKRLAGRPCRLQPVFRLLKVWLLEVDLVLWHCCCDTAEVFLCLPGGDSAEQADEFPHSSVQHSLLISFFYLSQHCLSVKG